MRTLTSSPYINLLNVDKALISIFWMAAPFLILQEPPILLRSLLIMHLEVLITKLIADFLVIPGIRKVRRLC